MGIKTAAALADDSINNTSCIYDIAFSKKCQDGWQTWVEMRAEYQGTLRKLQACREKYKDSVKAKDINDWEELGSMIADVKHMIRELDQKIMYEVHAIPLEEDILAILTPLQIQVVRYHEEGYIFSEVASIMGISPSSAIRAYKQAVKKIEEYLYQRVQVTIEKSTQQEIINTIDTSMENTERQKINAIEGTSDGETSETNLFSEGQVEERRDVDIGDDTAIEHTPPKNIIKILSQRHTGQYFRTYVKRCNFGKAYRKRHIKNKRNYFPPPLSWKNSRRL